MMDAINIDTYVKRQKEIFNAYIESNGKKASIMPFVEKYSEEDNQEYTLKDILKYVKLYVSSSIIEENELSKFNGTKKVSNKEIFNRGKLLVQKLIESKGNIEEVSKYADIFAHQDDKLRSYPASYLDTCRNYYLTHTKNTERVETYNKVMMLSNRSADYDVELLNVLVNFKNIEKAVLFVKEINISKTSLVTLRNNYKLLYPANKSELNKINEIIDLAFRTNEKVMKFINNRSHIQTNNDKIKILKRMIEEYLLSDLERIDELFPKYNFNKYKFSETIKDAKTSRDIILNNLINSYYAKSSSIKSSKLEILEKIMNAYSNGINYGNGFREFNLYDFYAIIDNNSVEDLLRYAKKLYKQEDLEKLETIFNNYKLDRVYKTKTALIASITKFSKDERILTDEEKKLVADYMEQYHLPYTSELFFQLAERYFDNDVVIQEEEQIRRAA